MTPYLERDGVTIYHGDTRAVLPALPPEFANCCVTSPPYFGQRDYGTAIWEGGKLECDHEAPHRQGATGQRADRTFTANRPYRKVCGKCGALRIDSQLGLELTPEEYVAELVKVFSAVRGALREDGTLWLNLGDAYNAYNGGAGPSSKLSRGAQTTQRPQLESGYGLRVKGLKPKDLLGIPWRVAFALQADGWYLRSDIIWAKPNPMPESVTDRCTKAHEYIFLFAKSDRYYYDQDAIREPCVSDGGSSFGSVDHAEAAEQAGAQARRCERSDRERYLEKGRNRRSVWTVPVQSHEGHFATFPPELIEPCILAGCPEGGIVLDPFLGSGTTAAVAQQHFRRCVGVELSLEYCKLAAKRFRQRRLITSEAV